jgi:hypothetical protein
MSAHHNATDTMPIPPVLLNREPLVHGGKTIADVNNDISQPTETLPDKK